MFTEKIKEATLTYHQQTEKVLVGKMKSMRSMQDYIELLNAFYSYFGGLEQQIERYMNSSNLADYNDRRKTAALINDLKVLGGNISPIAQGDDLPEIGNYLQAFGALYVIEGSTLGGKIISKMIQQHLHINDGAGLSFFNSYSDKMQEMWDGFKAILNSVAATPQDEEIILQAANQTFIKFKLWLEK